MGGYSLKDKMTAPLIGQVTPKLTSKNEALNNMNIEQQQSLLKLRLQVIFFI